MVRIDFRRIYRQIRKLLERSKPVDVVTVAESLDLAGSSRAVLLMEEGVVVLRGVERGVVGTAGRAQAASRSLTLEWIATRHQDAVDF